MKSKNKLWPNPLDMAGTEKTHAYKVRSTSLRGRVGVRSLGGSSRIRVEPAPNATKKTITKMAKLMSPDKGWRQPGSGGQHRFSIVVNAGDTEKHLAIAEKAIGKGKLLSFESSPGLADSTDS